MGTKISALTPAGSVGPTDLIPIVQAGVTLSATAAQLAGGGGITWPVTAPNTSSGYINVGTLSAGSTYPAIGFLRFPNWNTTGQKYTAIAARTGTGATGALDSSVVQVQPFDYGIIFGDVVSAPGTQWNTAVLAAGVSVTLAANAFGHIYRQIGTGAVAMDLTASGTAVNENAVGATSLTTQVAGTERMVLTPGASYLAGQQPTDVQFSALWLPRGLHTYTGTATGFDLWNDVSAPGKGLVMGQSTVANTPVKNMPIASSTNANPIVLTMASAHNLATGDVVMVDGHTTNTSANGYNTITVLSATTFSIPVAGVGVGGATGTVQLLLNGLEVVPFGSVAGTGSVPTFFNTGSAAAYEIFPQGVAGAGYANTDYAVWVVFRTHAIAGVAADATIYTNDCVFDWGAGNAGIYLQNNGGTFAAGMIFDGSTARVAKSAISVDTWYVAQLRRSAGNMYFKVNAVAETGATVSAKSYVAATSVSAGKTASTTVAANLQIMAAGICANHIVAADTAANGALQRVRKWFGSLANVTVN